MNARELKLEATTRKVKDHLYHYGMITWHQLIELVDEFNPFTILHILEIDGCVISNKQTEPTDKVFVYIPWKIEESQINSRGIQHAYN